MKKFAFVILIFIPLISFGQAEKRYRSIIIDSVKALNGGRVDVKDTLLLDSLAVYNTDLSSQYTSRSLVDSAFVGVAVSSGGANTIYSADDNLAGNRIVTQGANTLDFTASAVDAFSIDGTTFSVDASNNRVGIGTAAPPSALHVISSSTSQISFGQDISNTYSIGRSSSTGRFEFSGTQAGQEGYFFTDGSVMVNAAGGMFQWGSDIAGSQSNLKRNASTGDIELNLQNIANVDFSILFANASGGMGIGVANSAARLNVRGVDATSLNSAFLAEDNVGTELFKIRDDGHVISKGEFSTTKKDLTLGAAVTTFATTGNIMQITGDGGGNTIATITGALSGQYLIMIFIDNKVTITDDNGHGANTIDLSAAFTSVDDTTIHLIFDGTSWYEISRSVN